ncbi:unnamed protein product [Ixodes persulcatus]
MGIVRSRLGASSAGRGASIVRMPSLESDERICSGLVPLGSRNSRLYSRYTERFSDFSSCLARTWSRLSTVLTTISSGTYWETSKRSLSCLLPSSASWIRGEFMPSSHVLLPVPRPPLTCGPGALEKKSLSWSSNWERKRDISSSIFFISASKRSRIELNSLSRMLSSDFWMGTRRSGAMVMICAHEGAQPQHSTLGRLTMSRRSSLATQVLPKEILTYEQDAQSGV